jgi:hypothetical protein
VGHRLLQRQGRDASAAAREPSGERVWFAATSGRIGILGSEITYVSPATALARPFGLPLAPDGTVVYTLEGGKLGRISPER